MDFFYAACLLGIHHLTLWQRSYDSGRGAAAGQQQVHLVHPRGAPGGGLQIQSAQASQHPLHRGRRRRPLRLHRRRQRAGRAARRT